MSTRDPSNLANLLYPQQEEEALEESILSVPPEQRRLHTETYDFTISTILKYLTDGGIFIPDFQRRYVWNDAQASRLVESLIIQCPIPVIYLNQERDERMSVIDGNQRLTSLQRFVSNDFSLKGLTAYPELEGYRYRELDPRFQRHIVNRTLRCIVISKDTHPQVKFDVFERLNSGSVKLTPQELRHGIYYGSMMKHVERLNKNRRWRALAAVSGEKRMRGEELILRFFALHVDLGRYEKPLAGFLNGFAERRRNATESELADMTRVFERTIAGVQALYGDSVFRVFEEDGTFKSPFNTALYDAEMLSISRQPDIPIEFSDEQRSRHRAELLRLFADERFRKAIGRATSDENEVRYRIDEATKAVRAIL